MIWAIVSNEEMEGYKIPPVFQNYREVFGKENIRLAVIDEHDTLDFIDKGDIVLLRTANKNIISTIEKRGVATTAETFDLYEKVKDKRTLNNWLASQGILVPKQYSMPQLKKGERYFVKPRFGGESFGITPDCLCENIREVRQQVARIEEECHEEPMIEEFIEGTDCTVACYFHLQSSTVRTHAIKIECDEVGGIQTHIGKFNYNEYCSELTGAIRDKICAISARVFALLGIKHHARIDFRMSNKGEVYLIDVNLLPGLGPSAHFAKCLLLTDNLSYIDAMWAIVNSAKRENKTNKSTD